MADWTYWANDARADRPTTAEFAVRHGLLCRPFFNAAGYRIARVGLLAPGDRLLLVHAGRPVQWFELQRSRRGRGIPESEVFELVRPESAVGRALLANRFRPDGRYAPLLTCLRVRPIDRPLETPAPHRSRNAIEPFVRYSP